MTDTMTDVIQRLRVIRSRETKPAVKVILDRALNLLGEACSIHQ